MDMAERKGSAFRRVLSSADRLSEAAISFGSLSVNTPVSRSSAAECSVTACDQRLGDVLVLLAIAKCWRLPRAGPNLALRLPRNRRHSMAQLTLYHASPSRERQWL